MQASYCFIKQRGHFDGPMPSLSGVGLKAKGGSQHAYVLWQTFFAGNERGHQSSFWPPSGASNWYPGMVFVYKQHRSWSDVLAEAAKRLEQMVSKLAL